MTDFLIGLLAIILLSFMVAPKESATALRTMFDQAEAGWSEGSQ